MSCKKHYNPVPSTPRAGRSLLRHDSALWARNNHVTWPWSIGLGKKSSAGVIIILIIRYYYISSPGHGPIGVLDPPLGCVWKVPRPRKVGAPGPSAAKVGGKRSPPPPLNLWQGHGDLVFARGSFDAFTIHFKNEKI